MPDWTNKVSALTGVIIAVLVALSIYVGTVSWITAEAAITPLETRVSAHTIDIALIQRDLETIIKRLDRIDARLEKMTERLPPQGFWTND